MKRMTSIKLPVSAAAERDKEGFIKEDIRWQEAIPATAREATRREQVQAIQCEYSASNSPYNEAVSELDYGVRSANVLANETSAKMPFISDGSSLTKLRAHKVLSKSDYSALKEKRADTIYYVYDDSTS